mmetsp:Transcript_1857/g.2658  ORF Transcript_1857/g.2658 Transcript_1857/m.2658 type:complete len:410 (+) Transcript_1857:99-1328(+)
MSQSVDDFFTQLQQSREKVPKKVTSKINEIARKAIEEMSKAAGKFLHEDLDDDKHTEEQVKAIIELFPESLSQEDEKGYLPIQSALFTVSGRSSVTFVPLMAREGCRLGVGGEESRGGLLSIVPTDDDGDNTIQWLSGCCFMGEKGPASDEYDRKRAQVLEKLRDLNLLKKADIEEYGLVHNALHPKSQRRFDFFTSWDPAALEGRDSQWMKPIHRAIRSDREEKEEKFEMVLKAGMEYFPERLGFLFCKKDGISACKKAFDEIGVDKAMKIIRTCIPPSDDHPILHHAIRHAPDLENDIAQYYPDAVFLRDTNNHTLSQVEFYMNLRRGKRTFKNNSCFFIKATDAQVNTMHPETGLYPFMLAAVGNKSDLAAVYYLLSRNPKLVGHGENKDSDGAGSSRKRQREDID